MAGPLVVIFHQAPRHGEPPLARLLADARKTVARHQAALFHDVGAGRVLMVTGNQDPTGNVNSFGRRLAGIVDAERPRSGIVVLGAGAVPLLRRRDAVRLIKVAASGGRRVATNNRFSSDVCALSDARILLGLPPLLTDNPLPRWLEEHARVRVTELPGRNRLALDLDTPLDLALLSLVRGVPVPLRTIAEGLAVPRLGELRELAADPCRELLVAGRTNAGTLRWLERHTRCRIRFLAEERGLKAAAGLPHRAGFRPPRSVLGRLLAVHGPGSLGDVVSQLADGAIIDSRVLLADRLGADESSWPRPEDRFASDLLSPDAIADPWLATLTRAAATSSPPILLGAHTVVGPGSGSCYPADPWSRSALRAAPERGRRCARMPAACDSQAPTPRLCGPDSD